MPPTLLIPHDVPPVTADDLQAALDGRLPADALERARTPAATEALLPEAAGVLAESMPDLDAATDLEWVQALSAGVDGYDRDALADRGVVLTNASGVHAEPIGEQVLWFLLSFARNLDEAVRQQADDVWLRFHGGELRGRTLGVIGVGAIGERVAELAGAFDMTVLGTKRDTATVPDPVDELYAADEYAEVLVRSDYVVLACPLTSETRGLIGADELALLHREAVLVNVARGEVVDEEALVRALQQDAIRGAGLDVFREEPLPPDSPLWDLPNVLLTPHMAGSTPHWPGRIARIVERNYAALRGEREWQNRVV
jgi:phosphoglycerate dehydrogenase-like enzyme